MIRSFIKAKRTLATCVLLAGLCIWTPAFAQLDYDTYDVYQGGALVGTIYVPQRGPDSSIYFEYWVVSNRYIYPSEKNLVTTQIVPSAGYHYTSLADLLAKVPWGDGYRYITVVADDRAALPGRTSTVGN